MRFMLVEQENKAETHVLVNWEDAAAASVNEVVDWCRERQFSVLCGVWPKGWGYFGTAPTGDIGLMEFKLRWM